jgi:hypothetical protein
MYRDDSLWWFAELYLHKTRAILALFRAVHAATALVDREQPRAVRFEAGDSVARLVVPQIARARDIAYDGPSPPRLSSRHRIAMDARSTALMLAALASPQRPSRRSPADGPAIAAFVHRAFWRRDGSDGGAESYIGPVLQALEHRVPPDRLRYVGVGPTTNFRARCWWRPASSLQRSVQPIESLVPRSALAGSSGLWAARHAMRRSLERSADLRDASRMRGCDCWPLVAEALAGIALLQFPWSARAMDEAGAAFDALDPRAALTYAEAGGWGRALVIEARRRGIPIAGLQHGFIYRHWLNYLHEPDEMLPASAGSPDSGFPLPDVTFVFDEYAARHLREAGRFPADSLKVTGSPRLDHLAATFGSLDETQVNAARAAAGAAASRRLVLLVTKYSEARGVLPGLLAAVRSVPGVQLAIKTHPAETPDPYETAAAGLPNIRVLPASAPLAPLMRASRAVVTVNSTVALDAMALGIPALSIGLPNNLSPFVAAGAMAGARTDAETVDGVRRLVHDEEFRRQLSSAASSLIEQWRMAPDGGAAERTAGAMLQLAERSPERSGKPAPSGARRPGE